jgi:hypothetical protein
MEKSSLLMRRRQYRQLIADVNCGADAILSPWKIRASPDEVLRNPSSPRANTFEDLARKVGIQSPPHSVRSRQAKPLLLRLWNAKSVEEEVRLLLAAPKSAAVLIAVLRDVLSRSIPGPIEPCPVTSNAPHEAVFAALLAHLAELGRPWSDDD